MDKVWVTNDRGIYRDYPSDTPARVDGKLMEIGQVPQDVCDFEVYNGTSWLPSSRTDPPIHEHFLVTVCVPPGTRARNIQSTIETRLRSVAIDGCNDLIINLHVKSVPPLGGT
jgi:hypothetical protein